MLKLIDEEEKVSNSEDKEKFDPFKEKTNLKSIGNKVLILKQNEIENKVKESSKESQFIDSKKITNLKIKVNENEKHEKNSKISHSDKLDVQIGKKWENKEKCDVKEILNKNGSLYVLDNNAQNLLCCRITFDNFPSKKEIFDKGKEEDIIQLTKYQKEKNLPDVKFWNQRFYYFSKFNEGILMDYESWYSVTPEDLSIHIAKLCGPEAIVVDAFCGSGGNVVQVSNFYNYIVL
jgi:hypothetical protein